MRKIAYWGQAVPFIAAIVFAVSGNWIAAGVLFAVTFILWLVSGGAKWEH